MLNHGHMGNNIDNPNYGIAIDTKNGVNLIPIKVEMVEHPLSEEERKRLKRHAIFGEIVMWTVTCLCVAAIGALVGMLLFVV